MNRRTLTAATAAALAAAALAGCKQTADTAGTPPSHGASASPAATAGPNCFLHYDNATGITVQHGRVAGTVSLVCNGPADDLQVSLTLAYAPPGTGMTGDQEAGSAEYQTPQPAYTATADCKPGSYALHVLWGANVSGAALGDRQWGKTAVVTNCETS